MASQSDHLPTKVPRSAFYVIRFRSPPFLGDEFVCVPNGWVVILRPRLQTAYVAYPREDPDVTNARVIQNEGNDRSWKLYLADIVDGFDTYEDAQKCVAKKLGRRPLIERSPVTVRKFMYHYAGQRFTLHLRMKQMTKVYYSPAVSGGTTDQIQAGRNIPTGALLSTNLASLKYALSNFLLF